MNKYRPLIVLGTSSGAGKSLLVTAFVRIFSDMGIDVVPFKVQNMSLNAGVGAGGEMAYAQIVQARAARVEPSVLMNPILLKPERGQTHIIVLGKYYKTVSARSYMSQENVEVYSAALKAFNTLQQQHELVVIEGAGSPAEINLKHDIANIRFAKEVKAKAILVADIERGGAFASIVGTIELVNFNDFIGVIFNKFRGDESLLYPGYQYLEKTHHLSVLGTVPYTLHELPEEDSLQPWLSTTGKIKISVIKTPHISNFTDFEIFAHIPDTAITYATTPEELNNSDLIIIPGSKMTVADLQYLKTEGYTETLKREFADGAMIMGICGGYQMLGKYIIDNIETKKGKISGLGFMDAKTIFTEKKVVKRVFGKVQYPEFYNIPVEGYEIHMGQTYGAPAFIKVYREEAKNVYKDDGMYKDRLVGTYFHGLFDNIEFTQALINHIRAKKKLDMIIIKQQSLNTKIDRFADIVKAHVNINKILAEL